MCIGRFQKGRFREAQLTVAVSYCQSLNLVAAWRVEHTVI
ncbi:hypothetical protein Loa_00786 [Legionella oakridgensis ATCC 33761 = DSM 21215]|uniref:Uncharacterized protein n=1 Tax=Legionella oakridgensis ATCC 33761 = DSM 21215 TaxID=1268635 RepID=W0BD80_9GAMM|nr:hypothetical protein Loa_00786 [Legionella oakridgensis ATCC 33761 = DSM 21215]ETO93860.1 hypothetical protein LOR_37c03930 [Legionella oakridgensis RV-2-2007]STY19538.1 Uncharacterised protein [Legionella longbeachae]